LLALLERPRLPAESVLELRLQVAVEAIAERRIAPFGRVGEQPVDPPPASTTRAPADETVSLV